MIRKESTMPLSPLIRPIALTALLGLPFVVHAQPAGAPVESTVAAEPPVDRRLSLNEASRAEIAAIKGVSKKLAEAIVAARPFASTADLLAVKGMGPKLLEKIRTLVRL